MMTTRIAESGLLVSRCMALAAQVYIQPIFVFCFCFWPLLTTKRSLTHDTCPHTQCEAVTDMFRFVVLVF